MGFLDNSVLPSPEQDRYNALYNAMEAAARARNANYFAPPEGNPASVLPAWAQRFVPNQPVRPLGEAPWEAGPAIAAVPQPTPPMVDPGRPKAALATGGTTPAAPQTAMGGFDPSQYAMPALTNPAHPPFRTEGAEREFEGQQHEAAESPNVEAGESLQKKLGFSWGGGVPEGMRPAIDSMVHDPFSGRAVQAHESTGGGGFYQPDINQMPVGQRPESWWQDQARLAALQKLQAEATDPYGLRQYAGKKAIDVASRGQEADQDLAQDQAVYNRIQQNLQESLHRIDSDPATMALPEDKKKLLRAQIQDRADQDLRSYQQFRAFSRSGSLPSGLFRSTP